jgi:hypothetical protein
MSTYSKVYKVFKTATVFLVLPEERNRAKDYFVQLDRQQRPQIEMRLRQRTREYGGKLKAEVDQCCF